MVNYSLPLWCILLTGSNNQFSKLRILNVLDSQIAFDKKERKKNIGRKIRERSEAQFRNWLLDPAIQIYTKYISSRPMNLTILSRKVK